MLLAVTSSTDATADFLLTKLAEAGVEYTRLDTDALDISDTRTSCESRITRYAATTEAIVNGTPLTAGDVGTVWFRRPKPPELGDSPEMRFVADEMRALWAGFLSAIPTEKWINHPRHNSDASSKLSNLRLAAQLGITVPDTLASQDTAALRDFAERYGWNVVAKPIDHGEITGDDGDPTHLIFTRAVDEGYLADAPGRIAPTLLQQRIDGRNLRVTIVDQEYRAVAMHRRDGQIDIRYDHMKAVEYEEHPLPPQLERRLLELLLRLKLRFGAIDLIRSGDDYHFLEVNPNGQWAWIEQASGIPLSRLFMDPMRA